MVVQPTGDYAAPLVHSGGEMGPASVGPRPGPFAHIDKLPAMSRSVADPTNALIPHSINQPPPNEIAGLESKKVHRDFSKQSWGQELLLVSSTWRSPTMLTE